MKRIITTLVPGLALALALFAADPTGVWKTTVDAPDGTKTEMTYDIHVQNGNVTGTITSAMGEMHIVDGKVDGGKIEFTVEFADTLIPHKGTFDGQEMKLEGSMVSQKFTLVLKKAS
jgi:hypothetical protein